MNGGDEKILEFGSYHFCGCPRKMGGDRIGEGMNWKIRWNIFEERMLTLLRLCFPSSKEVEQLQEARTSINVAS